MRDPEAAPGFGKRFKQAMAEVGITQLALVAALGDYRPETLSRLATGVMIAVPIDLLVAICRWAAGNGISVAWLTTGQGHIRSADGPAAEAAAPTAGYRTAAPEDVPTSADWWRRYVPVIGRVAAGFGEEMIEATDYPPNWAGEFLVYEGAPASAVAVRVKGDSMSPLYNDGDMVVVDPAQPANPGEVCCVLLEVDGLREARLKRLRKRGGLVYLDSLNPGYPSEAIAADRLVAAYRLIAHLPLLEIRE